MSSKTPIDTVGSTVSKTVRTGGILRTSALHPATVAAATATLTVGDLGHHPSTPPKEQRIKPIIVPLIPKQNDWHKQNLGYHHFPDPVGLWGGIRIGYVVVDGLDLFDFDDYLNDPSTEDCEPAPFYYYPCQPPYVKARAIDPNGQSSDPGDETETIVDPANVSEALKQAATELAGAWLQGDMKALSRLIPTSGDVTVRVEGSGSYSVKASDFEQMFIDGINHTRNLSYKVVETDLLADGRYELHAEHRFLDPWNNVQTVDHAYVMELVSGDYVIQEFRSSTYR